jgi:predicted nucleotidyltransferase
MSMDKEQLKTRLLEAVKSNPHYGDIRSVSLFGSHIHGTADEDSDVDILVEFVPQATVGFFKLAQIQRSMAAFIGRKVDLLTPDALSKYFREKVLQEAERIYER